MSIHQLSESYDPSDDDLTKRAESQAFNRHKYKHFSLFDGFIDYRTNPSAYIQVVDHYYIQTSFPYSVYNTKRNKYLTITYANYPKINIKGKSTSIHTTVGKMFIPNPSNKRIIDHRYGNCSDWRLENLRWATDSENGKNKHSRTDLLALSCSFNSSNRHVQSIRGYGYVCILI